MNDFYTSQLSSDQFELPPRVSEEEKHRILEKYIHSNLGRKLIAQALNFPLRVKRLTYEQQEKLYNLFELDKRFYKAFYKYHSVKSGTASKSFKNKYKDYIRVLEKEGLV